MVHSHHAAVETIGRNARRLNVGRATSHPFEKPDAAQRSRSAARVIVIVCRATHETVQPASSARDCACYSNLR